VKDKWVNQKARTLDPVWRDPAGRAQKGNNGSRRPYIRPQSAGSWISRSRGVKPWRSIRYQSKQLINQIVYKGATASRVVDKGAPWEPTRSNIATSRRSGLGYQESPNWDAGSWGAEGITRLGQGGRFNPINKILALCLEDNEYNKPDISHKRT